LGPRDAPDGVLLLLVILNHGEPELSVRFLREQGVS
jgi:hypothetical protein